ncbi:TonB-dependent receptor [Novosphingobium sp. MMS21-SN21R]|uniref:TonB-dependent receptor n=1 Tax=Novosphingobium sp. MMS21-SN21R TaxID=2969298 RepID=UPI002886D501|nr:TonB-dependent receptor [Novosphingobium sp. MMS21-SN21R]MDT0509812.1 TonB-dependent receptor [Novosphingobium sp. MMS21-SN21R]
MPKIKTTASFRPLLVGSVGLLALTAGPAWAQTTTDESELNSANDIIVTAQRRAERLESVPVAIVALTADILQQSGVQRMTDIGQIATGVQINRGGSFTQPAIRGISTLTLGYGFENNTAVYVDGFYQPDMVTINGDLANLASVQVLKGPQGTLYGRNATAGAIVMETLAPSQETIGRAQVSYGRFNDIRAQAYVSVPLSEKLAFSLAGYYRKSDGYIRDIGTDPVSKADDRDAAPLQNESFRAKLLYTPTDTLDITLGFNHGRVEDSRGTTYTINKYAFAVPASPPRASARDTSSSSFLADSSAKADEFTGKIALETGIGTLTSYTGYAKRLSFSVFDFDGSKPVITQSANTSIHQRTFQQTLDYAIDAIDNLNLIVGGFYYNDKMDFGDGGARSYTGSFDAAGLQNSQFVFLTSKAYAFYGDATYQFGEKLFFTAGLRYSDEKRTIRYFVVPGVNPVVAPPAQNAANFSSATPRAVLRYEIAPRTSIYASFSKGFRSGVFNPTVVASPAFVLPIKPEKLTAYEVGFKTASSTFRFDAAAYYYDFRDLQVGVTIPSPVNANAVIQLISNAKRAESYGIEAQATYTPTEDLSIRAGASYTHGRYTDFKNATGNGLNEATQRNISGQVQDWTGQQMARAPSFTGNLGINYEMDMAGGRLALSGNASYTSSFVVSNPSLFGPRGPAGLANKQRYRQKGYGIANAQINWTDPSDHVTIGAYADNITNTRYNFVLSGGLFGDYAQGNEPVTYGVRAGFKF